jgi:hypothetical protein
VAPVVVVVSVLGATGAVAAGAAGGAGAPFTSALIVNWTPGVVLFDA